MSGNLTRAEATNRSAALSVVDYSVEIDVSDAKQRPETFGVVSVVRFFSQQPETWLDFLAGSVDSVAVNGVDVEPDYDGARIRLRGLSVDEANTVVVTGAGRYSHSGQGLHHFVDPVDGETYLYTHFEPADSRRLYPNFEQPDLKANFNFSIITPVGWRAFSNGATVETELLSYGVRHTFAPTPRLSTYLTALVAGPYAYFSDTWIAADGREVELGMACRSSLAEYFELDELFTITKQGMSFFDENFGYPYPWGKYDSVFVPEYNIGAMENPGCVTFNENYIFRSAATRAQRQTRANTILHEMSHMWFGDLVTPKWWDDLWLKESFAEFMGSFASASATDYRSAWVAFAGSRKAWAYAQDQLPTTHPIVAQVPDLESARGAFDGITYAKGAAVLRQLVAHVGLEDFFAASREYFRIHEFATATLADFLASLSSTSGRELASWSAAWLEHAGVDKLTPRIEIENGLVTDAVILREPSISGPTRPHTFEVLCYQLADGLKLTRTIEVDFPAQLDAVEVAELIGEPEPDLVLVNGSDLTYAKIRFSDRSLETIEAGLAGLTDPLARAVLWGALWDMTRDGEYPVYSYLSAVLNHAPSESDPATLTTLTNNAWFALTKYLPSNQRAWAANWFFDLAWQRMGEAFPSSDAQLLWTRTAVSVAVGAPRASNPLKHLLDGSLTVEGLKIDQDLRWRILTTLASLNSISDRELADELDSDNTAEGRRKHLQARSSRPGRLVKDETWRRLLAGGLTNDEVDALVAGLNVPGQDALLPYASQYFANLTDIWSEFPIELAERLVRGLFPDCRSIEDEKVETHPEVVAALTWLTKNAAAPVALIKIVREELDNLLRALTAQTYNAKLGGR